MKEKLPLSNLDEFERQTTLKFIAEREKDGLDCSALKEYIKPIIIRKPHDQGKGEVSGK